MQLAKKYTLGLVILVALSTVAATQYARSAVGYEFDVHCGQDANFRYVGHDYAPDGILAIRNPDGSVILEVGDFARGQDIWYTAAFGLVNENMFALDITGFNVTGTGADHIYIWLHNNANIKAEDDSGILAWDGANGYQALAEHWPLAVGDNDPTDMESIDTPTDGPSDMRAMTDPTADDNATDTDHVWIQVKLSIPESASNGNYAGTITIDTRQVE